MNDKLLAILRRHNKEIDDIASDWERIKLSEDGGMRLVGSSLGSNNIEEKG